MGSASARRRAPLISCLRPVALWEPWATRVRLRGPSRPSSAGAPHAGRASCARTSPAVNQSLLHCPPAWCSSPCAAVDARRCRRPRDACSRRLRRVVAAAPRAASSEARRLTPAVHQCLEVDPGRIGHVRGDVQLVVHERPL
eukprot:3262373-Pleurochrysis_carterae.AAC.1